MARITDTPEGAAIMARLRSTVNPADYPRLPVATTCTVPGCCDRAAPATTTAPAPARPSLLAAIVATVDRAE